MRDERLHQEVRAALRRWDPIGMMGPGFPQDEYDGYAWPVVRMIEDGAPQEEIVGYLRKMCVENMQMRFDLEKTEGIVAGLVEGWRGFRSESGEK